MRTLILILLVASASAQTCPTFSWSASYGGGEQSDCDPRALIMDTLGNVYAAGNLFRTNSVRSVGIVKFNSAGQQLWATEFVGPANLYDNAFAIAVEGSSNVYLLADTYFGPNDTGIALAKFDSNGQEQWSIVDHPTGLDHGARLKLDSTGNVYVVASFSSYQDWGLFRYSSNGALLWSSTNVVATFDTLALDGNDNVYIGGYSNSTVMVRKFDSSGALQWTGTHASSSSFSTPRTLTVDFAGNSYLATLENSGSALIKFDTTGTELWVATQSQEYVPEDAVLDSVGNVILTGGIWSEPLKTDAVTWKYDPDGNLLWIKRHDGFGDGGVGDGEDEGLHVAVDAADNIVVVGNAYSRKAGGYFLTKYDADGRTLWADFDNSGFYDKEELGVAIGTDGAVHVLGALLDRKLRDLSLVVRRYALPEANPSGVLDIKVKPIKLGTAAVDRPRKQKKLKLSNTSDVDCLLVDAAVSGAPFVGGGQHLIPARGRIKLPIGLDSSVAGVFTGKLNLVTSDPSHPLVEIPLYGAAR